ncbi:MAG: PA2169 family four-helix-bundle protein [Flavobacteriales bacterium]
MHAKEQSEQVHEIHDLLADSRKEYESASHRIPDERVKQLLQTVSRERVGLEEELAKDLRQHDPASKVGNGTVAGDVHRTLLTLRDALNSTSEVNVLVEMERQESDLLGHYETVLDSPDLDEFTRATLTRQHAGIEKNVTKVHDLRRQLESAKH